jgi:hypothetical protein
MTVAVKSEKAGRLVEVVEETETDEDALKVTLVEQSGLLHANLTIGANLSDIIPLAANEGLVSRGVQTIGDGFVVSQEKAEEWILHDKSTARFLRLFLNGKDLTATPRNVRVIDLFGISQGDALAKAPTLYQHLVVTVKPLRDQSRRDSYRKNWWILGEPQPALRRMTAGLPRYIASPVTAKHRFFVFLDGAVLADQALNVFAMHDAYFLGILSSRIHVIWSLASGGRLGVGNDPRYNNTRCFDPFPFPITSKEQHVRIRELAEALDAHRKRQQVQFCDLTMTDMYNVLEKLRAGTPLTPKEQVTHGRGLVSVLRQLHDDLDAAVAAAYGWPPDLSNQDILVRLVALNAQRAVDERNGVVRWLRPDYQNPKPAATQTALTTTEGDIAVVTPKASVKLPWPKTLAEQVQGVRSVLVASPVPANAGAIAKTFKGARATTVEEILETLVSLGQARELADERYQML